MSLIRDLVARARLYAFVDTAYLHGRSATEVTRQLCEGGADLIQLRAKGASLQDVRLLSAQLLPITQSAGIPLVINDHLEVAQALSAPLCHLGIEDFFDSGYRFISDLPRPSTNVQQPLIGISTHSPEQARNAIDAGADYIAIGPVYRTDTKPSARAVTLDYVRWAAENVAIPWFAIGGINLDNLDEVLAAGARRICVVSAILNHRNLADACQQFKSRLPSLPEPS